MIAFVARIAIVVVSLGSQVGFAVADSPTKLNVGPRCNAAARGAVSLGRKAEGNSRAHKDEPTFRRLMAQNGR
jgi:hypothetical protein